MKMYDYDKIIKKLKLDEVSDEVKLERLEKCVSERYDTLIRFYNYYLSLNKDNDDEYSGHIKSIKNSKAKTINGYLDLIKKIVNTTNVIAGKTISLNTEIHRKEKEKRKKKHGILKTMLFGSLFKDKKVKSTKEFSFEEEELEDDDFHFEDPD